MLHRGRGSRRRRADDVSDLELGVATLLLGVLIVLATIVLPAFL